MKFCIGINFTVHSLSSWRLGVKIHTTTGGRLSDKNTHYAFEPTTDHENIKSAPPVLPQHAEQKVYSALLSTQQFTSWFVLPFEQIEIRPAKIFICPSFCWFSLKNLSDY